MDISNNQIKFYKEEGAILLKGVFIDWVETLENGIEKLIKNPSPRERSYLPEDVLQNFFKIYAIGIELMNLKILFLILILEKFLRL